MTNKMALVETPLSLPMAHNYSAPTWTTFGRYNSVNRLRRPDSSDRTTADLALRSLAAEITRQLSTSPTGGSSYLGGAGELGSPIYFPGNERRRNFSRSRSLPTLKRDGPLKSCVPNERLYTPRRTKSVRFADTQGLPLVEAVHQLSSADSSYTENKIVPFSEDNVFAPVLLKKAPNRVDRLPFSASSTKEDPSSPKSLSPTHKHRLEFTQPGSEPDFFERVSRDNVVLESVRTESRILHGNIRVSNLAYDKEICVRWTHDNWRTFHDTCAVFCANDGHTDRFSFELPINGDDLQFALRYKANEQEFWDNNRGQNYCVVSES